MVHPESGELSKNEYILPAGLWPKSKWEVEQGVQTPSHTVFFFVLRNSPTLT
jgi:hypothetical protein